MDAAGRVELLNPVAERLTGWAEDEARGKFLVEVFRIVNEDTLATVESPVGRVLRDGVTVGLANHTLLIARDGVSRPIADSAAPVRDLSGGSVGVVLFFVIRAPNGSSSARGVIISFCSRKCPTPLPCTKLFSTPRTGP